MKNNKIGNYLNLTTTTVIGTIGAITGNSILQAIAFFPAVAYQISSDLAKHVSDNRSFNDELKSLIEEAFDLTLDTLSKSSKVKSDFFYYEKSRIEECIDNVVPIPQFIQTIQEELKNGLYEQAAYMTEKDVWDISKLFVECFIVSLSNYPNLNSRFLEITLSDHEKRIAALEKTPYFIADSLLVLPDNIFDDTQYYCDKFDEPLFLHRKLPEKDRITLNNIYILFRELK